MKHTRKRPAVPPDDYESDDGEVDAGIAIILGLTLLGVIALGAVIHAFLA